MPSVLLCFSLIDMNRWLLGALAVVLGGSMPSDGVSRELGVRQIDRTLIKYDRRCMLARWKWHTEQARAAALRTTALVSWTVAAEKYGATRFLKLASDLGLQGHLLDELKGLLTGGGQAGRCLAEPTTTTTPSPELH